ncbi:MAG: SDR family NAD(P)-dependent oxidoreductase, partial [Bdellovibrionales bacterium]|nr:SDR family NAD(P)-dependent oxidoreductase [Bdellovibrionales bacterium]
MKKVAIITGAGRGIGAAVACGLANEEYEVVLIARKREQLEQVAQEIGKPTAIFALDVRDL